MRRLAAGLSLLMAALAGCADQSADQPGGPTAVERPSTARALAACQNPQTARQIELLIDRLFMRGDAGVALQRWAQIKGLLETDVPQAQAQTIALAEDALDKFTNGQLNTLPEGTGEAVSDLITLMFCYTGIDGAASLYQPGSPPLLLIAPSGFSGISLPAGTGTVTVPTIISLNRIQPDFPGPLLTPLDQYPLYYQFNTSSGETFLQDATVGVCLAENVFPPDPIRLRLGHNVPEPTPNTIEILPPAPGFLDCTGSQAVFPSLGSRTGGLGTWALRTADRVFEGLVKVLGPEVLYATTLATTGTTGTTKNLSPFGAVDTLGKLDAASPPSGQRAPRGRQVAPPKVQVLTPTGVPMPGITVTFTVIAGSGKLTAVGSTVKVTTVVAVTDAQGLAAVGTWTLGQGSNIVSAGGTAPHPGSGFIPLGGLRFRATGL
jgi:hypothetical protein